MKHFILDCERMKYQFTGLYSFCLELGKALKNQIRRDENLSFYLPENRKGIFGNDDSYIIQRSLHKFFMPGTSGINVWHSTYQNSNYFPFKSSSKIILTIHDLNFLHEDVKPEKRKKILADLQRKIDRADRLVVISDFVKNDVKQHLHLNNTPVSTIYNGCNRPQIADPVKPSVIPVNPFIFSVGTINAKKNFHVLVPLLRDKNLSLVISGVNEQDDYRQKIIETATRFGVLDRLHLTGPISENDKTWYLKNCIAFAFPSFAEGFGLPVLEAMQFGKPVFLSDKTSLPEIGGAHAYYFRSFDPEQMQKVFEEGMVSYINNPSSAENIKIQAAKFSWEKTAKHYLEIYRELSA